MNTKDWQHWPVKDVRKQDNYIRRRRANKHGDRVTTIEIIKGTDFYKKSIEEVRTRTIKTIISFLERML